MHSYILYITMSITNRQKIGEMPKSIMSKFWSLIDSNLLMRLQSHWQDCIMIPCTLVAIIPSSDWKRSHITPVHKDWVEDDPTNYRLNCSFSIIGMFLEWHNFYCSVIWLAWESWSITSSPTEDILLVTDTIVHCFCR